MRTKTTLLCAAALAAGVVGSMAQSNVYSLNIVGYVNTPVGAGNNLFANPLNLDGTNSAANILTLAPLNDTFATPPGDLNEFYILTWNGRGFNSVYFESDFTADNTGGAVTNGWATDNTGSAPGTIPNLPPGIGFFINNAGPNATNTFVGSVVPLVGATNSIAIGAGNNLFASALAVSGSLASAPFQLPLAPLNDTFATPPGDMNEFYVLTWNGRGYNSVYYESDFTADNTGGAVVNGWATDNTGSAPGTIPTIGLSQGFFINNAGPNATWSQTYPIP